MKTYLPFGINFYPETKNQIITKILRSTGHRYSYIVTPNINHIVRLRSDEKLQQAYCSAAFKICDSKLLKPLLKILGTNITEAIPGSTLTSDLMLIANKESMSVTVIGCNDQEIKKIKLLFPNIKISHHNPPMGFIKNGAAVDTCIQFIKQNPADLIFYCVGCPQQEILAHTVKIIAPDIKGVGLCVGASLNFISGKTKRAPEWMQKAGLEWLHRMLSEPNRLIKRYFNDAIGIIPIILNEFRRKRKLSKSSK